MRDQLFIEGPERSRRLSRYWLLLPLSAVIASAGVVSDSTATVIGAPEPTYRPLSPQEARPTLARLAATNGHMSQGRSGSTVRILVATDSG